MSLIRNNLGSVFRPIVKLCWHTGGRTNKEVAKDQQNVRFQRHCTSEKIFSDEAWFYKTRYMNSQNL
jgi:hypothetical protein